MAKLSLVRLAGNTYYIPSPTNVGVYINGNSAILIDSGNDKEAGRQILRLFEEAGWPLEMIVNTHSNADHIGGNNFLQEKTGCQIAATRIESAFINDPILEISMLYGGFPYKALDNKFLRARSSKVTSVIAAAGKILDTGLEAIPLPGHFFDMIGILTPDNVFFIADSLFPENIINKYHFFFLFDLQAQFDTLERLTTIRADLFVPGHGRVMDSLDALIGINRKKIDEILNLILDCCEKPSRVDQIMAELCKKYNLDMNPAQHVLVGSTLKSYLSFLHAEEKLSYSFSDGAILWQSVR
ncbi:MAG: MBL fold metallo-hydrolase [Bacillota bacterium]|nr:MBL fold metallo-hydrolase [Bacillota bacterium]